MSDLAIQVESLSKQYRIGPKERYQTLRDSLTDAFWSPFRTIRAALNGSPPQSASDTIWALRDVSLEVKHGEVLGIIGRNGAGKSTLLKILSRITEPTEGRVQLHGRVGSLLEAGTGFNPELTGRENIFLNGAILGMRRREIQRKFDEIVAFAELEKFLDTPVKRYSSGMYMRLAFSVAAHLEPEILVVDEVLAVGDAQFQKKCLGKMGDVARIGRTVLFVSHNMNAITRLCQTGLLLDSGQVVHNGPIQQVVAHYLKSDLGTIAARRWPDQATAPGSEIVRLQMARVRNEGGQTCEVVDIRQPLGIEIEYEVIRSGVVLVPNFHFYNQDGVCAFVTSDQDPMRRNVPSAPGFYTSTVWVPGNFLAEGMFVVDVAISTLNPVIVHVHEREAVAFQVVDSLEGDSARGEYAGNIPGIVRPLLKWDLRYSANGRDSRKPSL